LDTRNFGLDTGWFKVKAPLHKAQDHHFDALDKWNGTDKEVKYVLVEFNDGTWTEPGASWYVSECDRKKYPWGSWHFLRKTPSIAEQVAAWLKTPYSPYFPRQIDYEYSRGLLPNASELLEACRRVEDAEKRPCIIYTRVQLVVDKLATMPTPELNARWWWLAQYNINQPVNGEHKGPPSLAIVRNGKVLTSRIMKERVIIQQTADHLSPPLGFTPDAKSMDYDRWCGIMTLDEFTGGKQELPLQ
jgi:hypothetical protein